MNLDEVTEIWRSQNLSPLYGVDKNLLHQMLRQEQAQIERRLRRVRWFGYLANAFLLITAGLFLAILIDPKDDDVLTAWDYVLGAVGVAAAITLARTMVALRRSQQAREQGFGDSLRDQLRRRIAQLDGTPTRERRLALIAVAATLICGWAISIASRRIDDVPYGEFNWSPLRFVLIFGLIYLFFWWTARRGRRRNLPRKRQLEALLKDFDGQ